MAFRSGSHPALSSQPALSVASAPNGSVPALLSGEYMFLHIPKTGGTSIDSVLPDAAQLYSRRKELHHSVWGHTTFAPWHLAPDVYDAWLRLRHRNATFSAPGQPVFCVVRNPFERLISRLTFHENEAAGAHRPAPNLLAETCRLLREAQRPPTWVWPFDGFMQHAVPQSWFVWSQLGATQCQCVVAFEKLSALLPHTHLNSAAAEVAAAPAGGHFDAARFATLRANASAGQMPDAWKQLYHDDYELWRAALHSSSLCYTPPDRKSHGARNRTRFLPPDCDPRSVNRTQFVELD